MPIYTYRREDGTTFEYRQRFADDPLDTCPTTGQSVTRVVQAPGIIFKGSGFYVNDSKSASKNGVSTSKSTDSTKEEAKPAEAKTETKTETKPEKKVESAAD